MPGSTTSSSATERRSPGLWVTILAGGTGSRFWPVSTGDRPKQLLPLTGSRPLIAQAVGRALTLVEADRIRILAGASLVPLLRSVLPDLPDESYLREPRVRGTAPVLAWAAHRIAASDPGAVQVSLHADHHIEPVEPFKEVVRAAAELAAREDVLVTVGVRPDRPETGYGYIERGEALETSFEAGAWRVESFHEKPEATTAARYVDRGFLWNTGIFVWKASTFLEEIRRHTPEIAEHLALLDRGDDEGFFEAVPKCTVDVVVMERSRRVAVLPATFEWDDVGAWHSLFRTRPRDEAGNVVIGEGHVVDGHGNVVYTDQGPLVLFGVDDLVAVRTRGVTLVTTRERAADLKALLDELPPEIREAP